MSPAGRAALIAILIVGAVAASHALAARLTNGFPHAEHSGLFPVCVGCHTGIVTGDSDAFHPEPESCGSCHDGERVARTEWPGAAARQSNMRFDHVAHDAVVAAAGTAELECAGCHTAVGAPRMEVQAPIVARCMGCHTHQATDHFVDADCRVCHRPLVESSFPAARLAALPVPATHGADEFLAERHGALAATSTESCATCHAREQCAGCHVAVTAESPINGIAAAGDRVDAPRIAASYPIPATHTDGGWEQAHGATASRAACGTCHTRESCSSCHLSPPPRAVLQLPGGAQSAAPGVRVLRRMPASHDSRFFDYTHGQLAAERPRSCNACHEVARFCVRCHSPGPSAAHAVGVAYPREPDVAQLARAVTDTPPAPPRQAQAPPSRREYHLPGWAARHSAQAWGRRLDCTTCHSTQLFCRDCHLKVGLGVVGNVGPGYHDAEPIWLLRHGQAARQTLESCISCHTQRDCMQCHSQLGAFRVSPHGPGFDARAARNANPQICSACHLGDPLVRGGAR